MFVCLTKYLGVMPHCIDSPTILSIVETAFNGQNWKTSFNSDTLIKTLSK